MKIANLGPQGTFTELASRQFAKRLGCLDPEIRYVPVPEALRMVQNRQADYAVVAVENTVDGVIGASLDSIIDYHDFVKICDEVFIPVSHALAAPPGVSLGDIRTVYSHPTALNQCTNNLDALLPEVCTIPVASTAEAAKMVSDPDARDYTHSAALCNEPAAAMAGLTIIKPDMQDYATNSTRFLVCSLVDSPPTGNDRTLMAIRPGHDMPGLLYGILGELATRNLNLTFIQSRPYKIKEREYLFVLEAEGHKSNPDFESALKSIDRLIRASDGWKKVLGSYPKRDMEVL